MIIELLLDVIYNIMETMLPFNLPQLPDNVMDVLYQMFDYIAVGCGIVANYTHLDMLLSMFGILLLIDGGIMIYHFVMWIIKKIPVLGIE